MLKSPQIITPSAPELFTNLQSNRIQRNGRRENRQESGSIEGHLPEFRLHARAESPRQITAVD